MCRRRATLKTLHAGRAPVRPRPQPLEGRGGPEHGAVREAASDDLQPDRQAVAREPAGTDAAGWPVRLNGYVNGIHA